MIDQAGFALYVHWPFCLSKCPYCDFNSHVEENVDQDTWRSALLAELKHYAAETPGRTLTSIFFGGGTPSLMSPETVSSIIDNALKYWASDENPEVTLEANPTSVEAVEFSDFRQAGVNRVSVGVQSLDADALAFLGRRHSADEARHAVELADRIFERYSFDLIYARPDQSLKSWEKELTTALALAGDHLSLYQLSIEPGTPFFRENVGGAEEDMAADLFDLTQRIMRDAGLPAYEISNHAKPGAECRHNLTCWRGGDYIGIGPGAHGRLTLDDMNIATHQIHSPETWLAKVRETGHGTAKRRPQSAEDRANELVIMGLRLNDGLDLGNLLNRYGLSEADIIDLKAKQALIDMGFLRQSSGRLRVAGKGRLYLNSIIARLLN